MEATFDSKHERGSAIAPCWTQSWGEEMGQRVVASGVPAVARTPQSGRSPQLRHNGFSRNLKCKHFLSITHASLL